MNSIDMVVGSGADYYFLTEPKHLKPLLSIPTTKEERSEGTVDRQFMICTLKIM